AHPPRQRLADQSGADRRLPARHRPRVSLSPVRRERLLAQLAMLAFAALVAGSFTTGAMAVPWLAPVPLNTVRFVLAALLMGLATYGTGRHRFALPPA